MKNSKKIRLCVMCSLVFCFMGGCLDVKEPEEGVSIYYEFGKAKKMIIARSLLDQLPQDSIADLVYIKRAVDGAPRILGEYSVTREVVLFEPAIPFTPGLVYELYIRDKKHSAIAIPAADGAAAPVVMNIYPTPDTLPENLLKVYIQFSQPMQEGSSAGHIVLVKGANDTLQNVFLDLQPELWNHDRTLLTLWLDPGRIKRDLQPNQQLGPPLVAGASYHLIVKPGWQDGSGSAMKEKFVKKFITISRDTISPDPALWKIETPKAGGRNPLVLELGESLDHELISSAITIIDAGGKEMRGQWHARENGTAFIFRPAANWLPGNYTIEIESKLEDLAGNNLNRLFDTDLAKPQKKEQPEIYRLPFRVQ